MNEQINIYGNVGIHLFMEFKFLTKKKLGIQFILFFKGDWMKELLFSLVPIPASMIIPRNNEENKI